MTPENRDGVGVPLSWQVLGALLLVLAGIAAAQLDAGRAEQAPASSRGVLVKCPKPAEGSVMVVILAGPDELGRNPYRCVSVASRGAYGVSR